MILIATGVTIAVIYIMQPSTPKKIGKSDMKVDLSFEDIKVTVVQQKNKTTEVTDIKNNNACSEFRQKVVDRKWTSKSSKDVKEYYKSNGAGMLKVMFADVTVNTVFTS